MFILIDARVKLQRQLGASFFRGILIAAGYMAVDLKLSMKLGQQMVMTPQLQAAIKLLQMNRLELTDTIRAELMENPLLEETNEVSELDQKKAELEREQASSEKVEEVSPETSKDPDFDWDAYLEQSFSYTGKSFGLGRDPNEEDGPGFEAMATKADSLNDHLMRQVHLSDFDDEEKDIANIVIQALDDWGYLKEPIEELARQHEVDPKTADLVLRMIQEFDPPGVGARDLRECLLLQLKSKKFRFQSHRELLQQLVEDHLQNLEKKNFKVIAKDMDLELDELAELLEMLHQLEPRPGRPFVEIENPYITPDIYIHKMNDDYVITMNEDGLPKLKVSNLYRSILQEMPEAKKLLHSAATKSQESVEKELEELIGGEKPEEGKEDPKTYIQNKLRGALWLIRSIHQRQRTIFKVTESIIKNQRQFLEHGISHLRPMVLKDIASDIGMHESTISRVTSNKYVHTPQGIFELKFFFSSAIQKLNGEDIAAESVKDKIRQIVKNEDETKPISDQGIVEALRKQGIDIARRTVAKYREVLGILPSSQRKSLVNSNKVR